MELTPKEQTRKKMTDIISSNLKNTMSDDEVKTIIGWFNVGFDSGYIQCEIDILSKKAHNRKTDLIDNI